MFEKNTSVMSMYIHTRTLPRFFSMNPTVVTPPLKNISPNSSHFSCTLYYPLDSKLLVVPPRQNILPLYNSHSTIKGLSFSQDFQTLHTNPDTPGTTCITVAVHLHTHSSPNTKHQFELYINNTHACIDHICTYNISPGTLQH